MDTWKISYSGHGLKVVLFWHTIKRERASRTLQPLKPMFHVSEIEGNNPKQIFESIVQGIFHYIDYKCIVISNLIYIQLSVPPFYKLMFDIFMLIFLRKIFIHHFLPFLVGLREMLNDMSYLRPFFICARECCFARKDS